jgi:GT2 family glycosyltransferase
VLTVSAVLPVHADSPEFRRSLTALRTASPPFDEVIVVCDGPAPGAAEAAIADGFRVVRRDRTGGPAAARNDAARVASGQVIFFVDSDVAVHPEIAGRVRAAFEASDADALVGVYDDHPPAANFFSRYKNLLQRFIHLAAREDGATFWGACGAIRREALFAVGGFDERFDRPSVEDIDLGYRLTNAGLRIEFRKDLEVTHLKKWTFVSLLRSDIFRRALPWTWLMMRESHVRRDLNLRYRHRVAGVLSCLLWAALPMTMAFKEAWAVVAASAAALTFIDHSLWAFFRAHGGPVFATAGLLWHWVYYAYSTVTFGCGVLLYPFIGRNVVGDDGRRAALESPGRSS